MTTGKINDNLYKALGIFLETIRAYIIALLRAEAGENWSSLYYDSLTPQQKTEWDLRQKKNEGTETIIDFRSLKGFSLRYKDMLEHDFGKKVHSLPTWFDDIAETRNKCQHFTDISPEEMSRAYSNMIIILEILNSDEARKTITSLRDVKPGEPGKKTVVVRKTVPVDAAGLTPWFAAVSPHLDIRQGNLDESVFAANLAEVASGSGREIYRNPALFFSKTYPTEGLVSVIRKVVRGMNGGQDIENRVISLQTGFGGGKTHALIFLYHFISMGRHAADSQLLAGIISASGKPNFEKPRIAVFTNTTNDPTQGRTIDGIHIRTLWGEIAYQLGGKEGYERVRPNDENRTAPKGLFKKVLEGARPALILLDEIADYCVAASGVPVGASSLSDQTISFIQELSEAVASVDKCVVVATLPASVMEVANSTHASAILTSLSSRLGRVGADTRPVADEEIFQVIRRRLFEDLGDDDIRNKTVSAYMELYESLKKELPDHSRTTEYRDRLMNSYPFHPELIDMFRIRWASSHEFQRTRGVLRLLACIVSDLWKRQESLTGCNALIHTSDVNFQNLDPLAGQLKKLYGNGYDAVITADVSGASSHAFRVDKEKSEYGNYGLTRGVAATILLGSFGSSGPNQGIGVNEIKLCVLKPGSFNHNSVNGVLDALEGTAHYLYYSSTGNQFKRYWFHTKPNLNILISQTKGSIKAHDVNAEILKRVTQKPGVSVKLQTLVNPSPDIPEQKQPVLVILGPEYLSGQDKPAPATIDIIKKIALKRGNGERIYRNTILFLVCSEIGYSKVRDACTDYLSCLRIQEDYKSQMDQDQKKDIKQKIDEYDSECGKSVVAAYCILVKYRSREGADIIRLGRFMDVMTAQINAVIYEALLENEWLIENIGLNTLKNNSLVPQPGKALRVRDVYEAFLKFDDKPIISGAVALQNSLLKYCQNGEFVIASGEGTSYTNMYYREPVPFFDVNDPEYWLLHNSAYTGKPGQKGAGTGTAGTQGVGPGEEGTEGSPAGHIDGSDSGAVGGNPGSAGTAGIRKYRSITISGKVDVANYTQIFTSFINPLMRNNVEIEISIKGKSTEAFPITENSDQYRITKESAKQLGLKFDTEE